MCEKCVKEEFPDRDTMCTDSGSYMMNFIQCCSCGGRDIKAMNRVCNETNREEMIKYNHTCSNCQHVCAEHCYTFKVIGKYQHYEMSCLLCGSGEDQRSVLPYDPREVTQELF